MERKDQLIFNAVSVSTKAMNLFFKDRSVLPELILISPPGSSGARVSVFKSSDGTSLYAVKCTRETRVSLSDEVAKWEILAKYIPSHLPKILWVGRVEGYETIISECYGVHTLHNLIASGDLPHDQLQSIWEDVVDTIVCIWSNSKTYPFDRDLSPRDFSQRMERIASGLYGKNVFGMKLSEIWNKDIYVNGKVYPSLDDTLKSISSIGDPSFGVTCHGDPQPSNIIVGRDDASWYCVDWEWSGPNHDWRMMASHLYGWWFTRSIMLKEKPTIRIAKEGVYLNYRVFLPDHLRSYPKITLKILERSFGDNLNKNARQDINRYLSALYLGDLRFLEIWNRENFAIPLLGQGIITAKEVKSNLERSRFEFAL